MNSVPGLFDNFCSNAGPFPHRHKPSVKNELLWGRLDSIRQADEDLLEVQLTGLDAPPVKALVPSEIEDMLLGSIGQEVIIGCIFGEWCCKEVPS
jgi:hypothetical protein